ncbi:MAG TPA: hypothetical protein VIY29_00830, partial [Ktedonobacteraceae bacterium]
MRNDDATGHFARRIFPGMGLLLLYRQGLALARAFSGQSSSASATILDMSMQAERPKSAHAKRLPPGVTNDVVRP